MPNKLISIFKSITDLVIESFNCFLLIEKCVSAGEYFYSSFNL